MNSFREIFDAQKAYFATNATKSYDWRIEQLDGMGRMLKENDARLQQAISQDFKTAWQEKVFEVLAPLATIDFIKVELKGWMEPVKEPVPRFLTSAGYEGIVHREPYGVALIMGPFNGPLTLLLHPALAALSAGNTCILKLHEALVATSALLTELVPRYFDPRAVATVSGRREEVTELLTMPFDFIFFTGSTKVGKIVMEAAAKNLTPVLLELGGQNPALVDETANLADAAKKIVWGATAWGGQWCTSPGYAYVQESVADAFVAECKKAVVELYGEEPKTNADYSRIISSHEVSRLASLIDAGKVVAGGASDPAARYIDPTILYPVSWDDPIMQDEIFGPLLPVLTYKTLDEAIGRIAKGPRPLGAYIFSRDQKTIDAFVQRLSFGGGAVNQTNIQLFVETMPFGGVGTSGMGHYYGKFGFDTLTHAKSILVSPPDANIDHLYPPYTQAKIDALQRWFEY